MKNSLLMATVLLLLTGLPVQAESLKQAFLASDVAARITALGYPIRLVTALDATEAIVSYYIPPQSQASDWDDETRLVLYTWHGGRHFERKQFISKAGKSISGQIAGLLSEPLAGGRLIAAVGTPVGLDHLVKTMIFYRPGPEAPFTVVFKRKDLGAAIRLDGRRLSYTHQEFDASRTRLFSQYQFQNGTFIATGFDH